MTATRRLFVAAAFAVVLVSAGCANMGAPVGWVPAGDEAVEGRVKESLTGEERLRLGAIYESKGEEELALREYEKASEADGTNAEAYFVLANLQLRMGRLAPAEDNYRKALDINPGAGPYHNNLGWLYMEKGQLAQAESEVRTAIDTDPERRYVYLDTLGVIQTRTLAFAEAERSLKVAASLTPETELEGLRQIYTHLAELYSATGDANKEAWARARLRAYEAK